MEKVKEVAKALNVLPKLRLGNKLPEGGVATTGPHRVKFLAEPTVVMGKDDNGKPCKELRFTLEEAGIEYRWNVPLLSKEGQPSYLIERLMHIDVGDERILEMMRQRGRNYIDVRKVDEAPSEPPEEEEESNLPSEEEIEATLTKEGKKSHKEIDTTGMKPEDLGI